MWPRTVPNSNVPTHNPNRHCHRHPTLVPYNAGLMTLTKEWMEAFPDVSNHMVSKGRSFRQSMTSQNRQTTNPTNPVNHELPRIYNPTTARPSNSNHPNHAAHQMTDFFTHLLPVMRDLSQWLGTREVSRVSIARALGARECCTLVPGGQKEIFSSRSWGNKVRFGPQSQVQACI